MTTNRACHTIFIRIFVGVYVDTESAMYPLYIDNSSGGALDSYSLPIRGESNESKAEMIP